MIHAPTIGQRVTTKFGPGTITGFERIESVCKPIQHPETFAPGDRIAVELDDPRRWACHSVSSGPAHFTAQELDG